VVREPGIGTEVAGVVPETGDRVEGTYLGSLSGGRHDAGLAVLFVDGRRVTVDYDSLEAL
jgi:hypothetical protein